MILLISLNFLVSWNVLIGFMAELFHISTWIYNIYIEIAYWVIYNTAVPVFFIYFVSLQNPYSFDRLFHWKTCDLEKCINAKLYKEQREKSLQSGM